MVVVVVVICWVLGLFSVSCRHLEENTEREGESDSHQTPGQPEEKPAKDPDAGSSSLSVVWNESQVKELEGESSSQGAALAAAGKFDIQSSGQY